MEDLLGRPAMSHSPARPVRDATRKRASPLRTLPLASDNKETPPAKRLRGKQSPKETPEKTLPCNERTWAGSDGTTFDALGGRARYMKFWNKWLFWKRQRRRVAIARGEVAVQDALEAFEGKSLKASSKERDFLFDLFLKDTGAPPAVTAFLRAQYPSAPKDDAQLRNCRSVLLTWNGDWGLCGGIIGKSLSPAEDAVLAADLAAAILREEPSVQELWEEYLSWMTSLAADTGATGWACSLELCTKSLKQKLPCRIHAHAFMKRDQILAVSSVKRLVFKGSTPYRSEEALGNRVRARGSWCGCYYLQVSKIGSLYVYGNKQPYVDYPVNPGWIFNLLQAGKVTGEIARQEALRTTQGLPRRLADLERWQAEHRQEEMRARVAATQAHLSKAMRPFPPINKVTAWLRKFSGICSRKKIIVLEGASGLGKTEYARSLLGVDKTLELNCAGSLNFCLREHDPLVHRCILWDEARVQLVLQERKLFQCPACWVQLGASPTGAHVYKVWVNDCLMIVGSNTWSEQLRQTPKADADWIEANQVLVKVKRPLWQAAPAGAA
jgi:hypothetical protein